MYQNHDVSTDSAVLYCDGACQKERPGRAARVKLPTVRRRTVCDKIRTPPSRICRRFEYLCLISSLLHATADNCEISICKGEVVSSVPEHA